MEATSSVLIIAWKHTRSTVWKTYYVGLHRTQPDIHECMYVSLECRRKCLCIVSIAAESAHVSYMIQHIERGTFQVKQNLNQAFLIIEHFTCFMMITSFIKHIINWNNHKLILFTDISVHIPSMKLTLSCVAPHAKPTTSKVNLLPLKEIMKWCRFHCEMLQTVYNALVPHVFSVMCLT